MAAYLMTDYISKAREAAAEGIVLLENRDHVLPFAAGTRIALFGRSQFRYYKSGTGSGGLVNTGHVMTIPEALEADGSLILNREVKAVYEDWLKEHPFDEGKGWASEPWHQEEMRVTQELMQAASSSEAAVVIIGRTAGEDQDNSAQPGSYYLTETEEDLLEKVCNAFEKTVVLLNAGNIIDMSWVGKYRPSAVACLWQGRLGKAARSLCGFAKTALLNPGESETLTICVPAYAFSSYDDSGVTGHKSCYVLEAGSYDIYVGTDVRSAQRITAFDIPELIVVQELSEALAPTEEFEVIRPVSTGQGNCTAVYEKAAVRTIDLKKRISDSIPAEIPYRGDRGITLADVADGVQSMEAFISQFSDEDLTAITRGEGMCSPKVTPGIAGAIGGVSAHLKAMGIPAAGCSDGPSGIRMDCGTRAFAMPNGMLLASTFNEALCEELYEWEALELRKNKIDMLLGPGMNIHRNPLNGRNFEYFSEDPFLTGKMASAQLKGMHKYHVTGTIKHFAANNQETNRHDVETVASERALREIYLKGFEIAVREGQAYTVMSSYNPLNGSAL